ncbi:hypothetical protein [Paenibacillus pseudetheri]|uniref:DZANK-type domain-containing protein n=1 Tax=Paenibacillus pseudetheri TaxID=2897682 RepID=A0ABM9BK24_9BACL|nr:hypothetical protein [Paenibacillus pseudetheri]CAH1058788.1 hypothetical protein PAECIP111894_04974 [Paenibacillus pseudetheri]
MIQRDWLKDMAMCKAATPGRWGWYEPTRCIYTARKDRDALDTILYDPAGAGHLQEEDAEFISEAREALPYWLQEAKELQEIVSGRGRELLRLRSLLGGLNNELTVTEARADAAEAREQKLIDIMHIIAFESDDEKTLKYASQMLSTIYPDTPSPKEQTDWINEESCARCGRNKPIEGYEWCSECRPDLKAKEDGSLVQCPTCNNRNLIPHPSESNIWLCGPCNQVIEDGTDINVD